MQLGALLRMADCPDSIIASIREGRADTPNGTLPDEKGGGCTDQSTDHSQELRPEGPMIRTLDGPVVVRPTSSAIRHGSERRMRSGKSSDRIKRNQEGQDGVTDGGRGLVVNWQHATAEQVDQLCRCGPGALRTLLNRLSLKAGSMRKQGDKGGNQGANLNEGPVEVLKRDWGELKLTHQETLVTVQVFLERLWNRSELREHLRMVFSSWLKQIRAESGAGPHMPPGVRRDMLLLADMWFLPGNAMYLELE